MLSFEQILGRAARDHHPVACMFIDLDLFKEVDDFLTATKPATKFWSWSLRSCATPSAAAISSAAWAATSSSSCLSSIKQAPPIRRLSRRRFWPKAIDRPIERRCGMPAHVTARASASAASIPEDAEDPGRSGHLAGEAMYEAKTRRQKSGGRAVPRIQAASGLRPWSKKSRARCPGRRAVRDRA